MSAITDPSPTSEELPDNGWQVNELSTDASRPIEEFRLVLAIYVGWAALVWLGHVTGTASIAPRTSSILLFGIGATNVLFFIIARSDALHRPPADTIALAQSVVAIAWATLFASMSTGTGEIIIGMYTTIVLFAILRVSRGVLNQVTVFAVISYSVVNLINGMVAESASIAAETLVRVLTFAGIMLCLSVAGSHVYRRHRQLENEIGELREKFNHELATSGANSVNRRYILELLAREKGRTDRSNVPFCVCVFTLDHSELPVDDIDEHVRVRTLKATEEIIRQELRDMDSLNSTGFHECFGPYSEMEYVAILPQTNLHGAQRSTERLLAAIPAQRGTPEERVTLHGGIAEYRRGESISALLARAEDALGEARVSGTSRVCSSHQPSGKEVTPRHADIVRLETRRR